MKRPIKFIILGISVIETLFLFYVGFQIYQKTHTRVLGVSVIHKASRQSNVQSNLKYYSEPATSFVDIDAAPWVKNVIWTTNSDTLNAKRDYIVEKPLHTYRIIALGDSFTFGDHVSTGD